MRPPVSPPRVAGIGGGHPPRYIRAMNGIVVILLILALGAVVASLFVGLFFMARGGQGDSRKSNTAMRLRVALQGVALVLFLLAILTQS